MEGNDETAASATSLPTSPVYDGQSFPAPSLSVLSNKGKMNDTVASAVSLVQAFQGYADARSGTLTKRSHSELIKQGNEEASATKRSHSEMINQGDEEASATKSAVALPQIDETAWAEALKRIPRCSAVEGIRESSVFCNQPLQGTGGRNHCLRKLLREIGSLNESLPSNPAIFIRFDCETPQFLRACITAPADTPYAYGLFLFDIFIPDNYPQVPPKFHLLTTGNGSVRFSPNLYADGKVCLSLLNTWSGPKWNQNSTLLQVLVSIQGLILGVEHPYYLEPGHGGWEGQIKNGHGGNHPPHVKRHEDRIRVGTLKFALLDTLKGGSRFLKPFRDVIDAHFYHHRDAIIQVTHDWKTSMGSVQTREVKQTVANLVQVLKQLEPPEGTKCNDSSAGQAEASSKDNASSKRAAKEGEFSVIDVKRREMEEAAANKDFVTAGRLQSEIKYLETDGFKAKITAKRNAMEEAASKKDYITAGELQKEVQHLEQQKHMLIDLETRMFDSAAKLDFVRAGRFQEQYRILLNPGDDKATSQPAGATAVSSDAGPSYFPSPPSFTFGSLPAAGFPTGPPPPPPGAFSFPTEASPFFDGAYDDTYTLDDV
jgi:ubiquitin-protein ligase